jgi:hypothetical protein
VPLADGVISVSAAYCDTFMQRYPSLKEHQFRVIPFGAFLPDFEIMEKNIRQSGKICFKKDKINVVYIGRGGHDMQFALEIIFKAFNKGLQLHGDLFSRVHLWFAGTSYAPPGTGRPTVAPVAERFGLEGYVTEVTDRLPYFESLFLLKQADALLVPGSTDTAYTASKIYPYILARKPLIAVFHERSSVVDFLRTVRFGSMTAFDHAAHQPDEYVESCLDAFIHALDKVNRQEVVDPALFEPYTAAARTKEQVDFFNSIAN